MGHTWWVYLSRASFFLTVDFQHCIESGRPLFTPPGVPRLRPLKRGAQAPVRPTVLE